MTSNNSGGRLSRFAIFTSLNKTAYEWLRLSGYDFKMGDHEKGWKATYQIYTQLGTARQPIKNKG